jgi:hypothetical protein
MSFIYSEQNSFQEDKLNVSFDSENSTTAFEIDFEELKEFNDEIINDELKGKILFISSLFEKLIENNTSKLNNSIFNLKIFENEEIPTISINKYIERIVKYTNCEENTLILSLIYLDKICLKNINLTVYNIHKFVFSSILVSIKFNEDKIYKNDYYAYIAGVSLKELNLMEDNFLQILDYQVFVNKNIFNKYIINLRNCCHI